jgi:hypothetical protein
MLVEFLGRISCLLPSQNLQHIISLSLFLAACRFGGRQIHASEDDGSVNHTLIRDYDAEVSRLDRFGEELEEST